MYSSCKIEMGSVNKWDKMLLQKTQMKEQFSLFPRSPEIPTYIMYVPHSSNSCIKITRNIFFLVDIGIILLGCRM